MMLKDLAARRTALAEGRQPEMGMDRTEFSECLLQAQRDLCEALKAEVRLLPTCDSNYVYESPLVEMSGVLALLDRVLEENRA